MGGHQGPPGTIRRGDPNGFRITLLQIRAPLCFVYWFRRVTSVVGARSGRQSPPIPKDGNGIVVGQFKTVQSISFTGSISAVIILVSENWAACQNIALFVLVSALGLVGAVSRAETGPQRKAQIHHGGCCSAGGNFLPTGKERAPRLGECWEMD